jgi:hypothetical protein
MENASDRSRVKCVSDKEYIRWKARPGGLVGESKEELKEDKYEA